MTNPDFDQSLDGIEVGDELEHPWNGTLKVVDTRLVSDGEDTQEWFVRDTETGETLWVNREFLLEVTPDSP